ncbi:MAG: hypothetical protein PVH19_12800 [Planctomycetia bacterium]|jgi:hypothetical protein
MSTDFRELAGSPIEWYDDEGLHAKRVFIIKWEDRDAFAIELLGIDAIYGGGMTTSYPSKTNTYAIKIRFEPLDPAYLDEKELASLTSDINSYSNSYAKATVEYITIDPSDAGSAYTEDDANLTYQMYETGEYLSVGSGGWSWTDTSTAIPSSQTLTKWVPIREHHLTWDITDEPPWSTIQSLQGTINNSTFLGCPAGTVLFTGVNARKRFLADFDEDPCPFFWRITYVFRERSVQFGSSTYGWNYVYRETPAGWVEVTNGTDKLYDSADLTTLFPSST